MKKLALSLLFTLPLLMLFSGCPVGVNYPLGTPGKEAIDKSIIGTWTTDTEEPDFKQVTIEKRDDYSYNIEIFETSAMYSLDVEKFVGWVTKIKDKKFLYSFPSGSSTDTSFYLYSYEMVDNNTMKSFNVGLLVNGVDGVTSTESYRAEVEASMGLEEFLTAETLWKKEK